MPRTSVGPLDGNLGVSHDAHVVTLWDLRTLEPIRRLVLPRFRQTIVDSVHPFDARYDEDPLHPSIRAAVLSVDRRSLVIAGVRDVLVWELRRDG